MRNVDQIIREVSDLRDRALKAGLLKPHFHCEAERRAFAKAQAAAIKQAQRKTVARDAKVTSHGSSRHS